MAFEVAFEALRRRTVAAAVVVLVTGLALSACGGDDSDDKGSVNVGPKVAGVKLVKSGKLTVCTNVPYEPFQFTKDGKTVGFDVDLVDLVAKKLGVQQDIIDLDFDAFKGGAAMNAGKCDLAAAGMTITEERKKNIDFSVPYFDEVLALMTAKGAGVKTLEDVKAKKLPAGVQAATTNLDLAKAKGLDPKQFKDSAKLLFALQSGQIKVAFQDLPVVSTWLKKPELGAKYEIGGKVSTGSQYGFALKKGNTALLNTINEVLNQSFTDGTWKAAYVKWMGETPATTPKPA